MTLTDRVFGVSGTAQKVKLALLLFARGNVGYPTLPSKEPWDNHSTPDPDEFKVIYVVGYRYDSSFLYSCHFEIL